MSYDGQVNDNSWIALSNHPGFNNWNYNITDLTSLTATRTFHLATYDHSVTVYFKFCCACSQFKDWQGEQASWSGGTGKSWTQTGWCQKSSATSSPEHKCPWTGGFLCTFSV